MSISVALASVAGVLAMALANRLMSGQGMAENLTPSNEFQMPQADEPPAQGHVMLMISYQIDPARAVEFRALMQESCNSRLRHSALSWGLLQDINELVPFVEMIEDEPRNDHLRRCYSIPTGCQRPVERCAHSQQFEKDERSVRRLRVVTADSCADNCTRVKTLMH